MGKTLALSHLFLARARQYEGILLDFDAPGLLMVRKRVRQKTFCLGRQACKHVERKPVRRFGGRFGGRLGCGLFSGAHVSGGNLGTGLCGLVRFHGLTFQSV